MRPHQTNKPTTNKPTNQQTNHQQTTKPAAYLEDGRGTTFPLVVDEVVSKQLFKAHTSELLPGGDYKLVVKSRAGDAGGPLQTSFRKVKYLRVVDPAPTGPTVTAINDGTFYPSSGNIVTGENMRFASDDPGAHVTVTDAEGHDAGARVTTDTEVPVTETRFGLVVEGDLADGAEYVFAFDMLDAAGQPVTVTKAARFSAS